MSFSKASRIVSRRTRVFFGATLFFALSAICPLENAQAQQTLESIKTKVKWYLELLAPTRPSLYGAKRSAHRLRRGSRQ